MTFDDQNIITIKQELLTNLTGYSEIVSLKGAWEQKSNTDYIYRNDLFYYLYLMYVNCNALAEQAIRLKKN